MILTCPSCGTQYVVKDGAIPPGGRQVRCAACKHSWHQDPEELQLATPVEPGAAGPDREDQESVAEATLIEPRSGPEAEERAYEEAMVAPAEAEVPAEPELSPDLREDAVAEARGSDSADGNMPP